MEERDGDILSPTGRTFRFTSDDIGWCTKCFVFFLVNTKNTDTYLISGRTTARREMLND